MAPFYALTLAPVTMICLVIHRFWACARRLDRRYYRELLRRAPSMQPLDAVAFGMAVFTAYYAAMGWWGFTLPFLDNEPLPKWQNIILSLVSSSACVGVTWMNAPQRFTQPTWGGMRESVIRTLAALRIIDEVALAFAVTTIEEQDTGSGQFMDKNVWK